MARSPPVRELTKDMPAGGQTAAPVTRPAPDTRLTEDKRQLTERQAALILLLPFFVVYALFLVYPFFRGIWISLHDWNLLAVVFEPGAKQFIGLENYVRFMWGEGIVWGPIARPLVQLVGVAAVLLAFILHRRGSLDRVTALALGILSLILFFLPGFYPGEGGRW